MIGNPRPRVSFSAFYGIIIPMTINGSELKNYIKALCTSAGEPEGYEDEFFELVTADKKLLKEFVYYAVKGDFLCEYKIEGLSVADILVWQTDRFKAAIDEGKFALKFNAPHMVLSAFKTMADVKENPRHYLSRFRSETGSDYEGKTDLCDPD